MTHRSIARLVACHIVAVLSVARVPSAFGSGEPQESFLYQNFVRASQVSLVALLSLSTYAAPPAQECRPDAAGVREIRAVATGIVAADNQRDIECVLGYYAADAILMPPGEAPVVGRDAIRPRYEALFAAFRPEIEGQITEACVLDDGYLMLLRFHAGGGWRISHLSWHRESKADDHDHRSNS